MKISGLKLIALTIFTSVFIWSCGSKSKPADAPKPGPATGSANEIPAEAYVVTPQTLEASVTIAGTLFPYEETEMTPEVAGKITGLYIREGAFVNKGAVLATLFDEDLKAQLNKLDVQLRVAKKTRERQDQLLKIGGISQQDYDLTILNESTIEADIAVLKAAINKTVVRAPYSGRLGFKNISMGAYVTPQTVLTTISQTSRLKLQFSVPEKYFSRVNVGDRIEFRTETSPKVYEARIVATEAGITAENRSLKVQAVVDRVDKNLSAGGFANIIFNLGKEENAVMIPSQSVIPQARDKKVIVYRNGHPDFATVTTGIRDSAKIEILSGIQIGDTVLTTGLLMIKPDSKIKISQFKK